jgi:uncharacterized protein (TIGR02466 family)
MEPWIYFGTPVYSFLMPEYLDSARDVCKTYLDKLKNEVALDEIYPMYQTVSFDTEPSISVLTTEIKKASYTILENQGYDLSNYELFYTEFWCQEHHKTSGQERHVHGYNNVLTGFYFIETPENCSRLVIHEPKTAKEFGNFLPEKNPNQVSLASQTINFVPEPGQLIITNSWLHHTFTRNENNTPFTMIHFNIGAAYKPRNAEIV